jgi:RNA polymerase primary sigma factor
MKKKISNRVSKEDEMIISRKALDGCATSKAALLNICANYISVIAKRLQNNTVHAEDLAQQGMLGLLIALNKYNPELGNHFITYGIHQAKSEMLKYVMDNTRSVRFATTNKVKKVYYNINKFELNSRYLSDEKAEEIALNLEVDVADVKHAYGATRKREVSFCTVDANTEEEQLRRTNYNKDNSSNVYETCEYNDTKIKITKILESTINLLNPRDEQIIKSRLLQEEPETLKSLAGTFSISIERVSQIEKNFKKKLKEILKVSDLLTS